MGSCEVCIASVAFPLPSSLLDRPRFQLVVQLRGGRPDYGFPFGVHMAFPLAQAARALANDYRFQASQVQSLIDVNACITNLGFVDHTNFIPEGSSHNMKTFKGPGGMLRMHYLP